MADEKNTLVEIKDFEAFLKKCFNCAQLKLVSYEATAMLPDGENFCSLIVKIDATIRKSNDIDKETLHFVAKTPAATDKAVIEWSFTFLPEVFAYTEIIPLYREVEDELKVEKLDFYPKYIGHRYSLNDDSDRIDEHSMLVLENLTTSDYYVADKIAGLDVEHARQITCRLARFHALGMAVLKLRPIVIEKMIKRATSMAFDFEKLDNDFDNALQFIRNNPNLKKHIKVIETAFAEAKKGNLWMRYDNGPWATIIHGDIWVNNMLFHKDVDGRVDNVKLIDYQGFQCSSLFRDLSRLLCTALDENTLTNHSEELMDLYFKTFIQYLKCLGCDFKMFTREDFDRELKRQSVIQFPLCAFGLHLIITKSTNDKSLVVREMEKLISNYEKRGWF